MFNRKTVMAIGLVCAAGLLGPSVVAGWNATPCEQTAHRAHLACRIDTIEEFHLGIANCLTIASGPASRPSRGPAPISRVSWGSP